MSGDFADADNLDAQFQNQELAVSPEPELSEFELLVFHRELRPEQLLRQLLRGSEACCLCRRGLARAGLDGRGSPGLEGTLTTGLLCARAHGVQSRTPSACGRATTAAGARVELRGPDQSAGKLSRVRARPRVVEGELNSGTVGTLPDPGPRTPSNTGTSERQPLACLQEGRTGSTMVVG